MLPRHVLSLVLSRRRSDTLLRRFISSSERYHALVGPPDPVSNIRPVIYGEPSEEDPKGGEPALRERTKTSPTHPYSLDEFEGNPSDYQWQIERKRLDAYNHAFWADSNTRFEAAKNAVLCSLPEDATPEYREAALSEFYRQWYTQERVRLKEYSDEWSRRNLGGIMLAARAAIKRFRSRVFGRSLQESTFTPNPSQSSPKSGGRQDER